MKINFWIVLAALAMAFCGSFMALVFIEGMNGLALDESKVRFISLMMLGFLWGSVVLVFQIAKTHAEYLAELLSNKDKEKVS